MGQENWTEVRQLNKTVTDGSSDKFSETEMRESK
jgi:hypothetical protein